MKDHLADPPSVNIGGGSTNKVTKTPAGGVSIAAGPGAMPVPFGEGTPKGADVRGMPVSGPLGKNLDPQNRF